MYISNLNASLSYYLVSARKPRNSVNLNGECRLLSGEDSSYLVELRSY